MNQTTLSNRSAGRSDLGDLDAVTARWFAVRVGSRKEKYVVGLLKTAGVETYLPLRDKAYSYKKRKDGVRRLPLLPGYVFVKVRQNEVPTVLRCTYVFGFVRFGKAYRQVTEAEIDALRRISTDDSLRWEAATDITDLEPGTPVEIRTGHLAGVRGHYLNAKTKKKFVITLGGLEARLVTLEIDPTNLIPLDATPLDGTTGQTEDREERSLW